MSHLLLPPATEPHSQAILLDQPFGEEFLHTLVHSSSEPIPFLKQTWGHLEDIGRLRAKTEKCDFSPPPLLPSGLGRVHPRAGG